MNFSTPFTIDKNKFFSLFIILCVFITSPIFSQTISSVTPNNGNLGDQLNVFIAGSNVNFLQGSSSIQTSFIQGSTTINAPILNANSAGNEIEVFLNLSNTSYPSGFYDLSLLTPAHGLLTFSNAFRIDTTALISASPNASILGQNVNVLVVGRSLDFTSITSAPIYVGVNGGDTIMTSIVQTRGADTLEISVNLSAVGIRSGNYDLLVSTLGGPLVLRNALELQTTNISGVVFYDANQNTIRDSNEVGLSGVSISLTPSSNLNNRSTNLLGEYRFSDLPSGSYQVNVSVPSGTFATTPQTVPVNITSAAQYTADFGISANNPQAFDSTSIHTYAGLVRCNRSTYYQLIVRNTGFLDGQMGVYYFIKDSLLTYTSTTMLQADSINGDTAYFSFNNLSAQNTRTQYIYCTVPSITILPVGVNVTGTAHLYRLNSSNAVIAGSQVNSIDSSIVRCSYDPNDKLVNPSGRDSAGYIAPNTPLEYTVRFQNTGNDTAFKVVLLDTLSNLLDFSSYQFLEASHPVFESFNSSTRELSFTFDNILLVDSATNEVESNGFVRFRIVPNAGLPDSTSISNRAGIYFDFNPPIITNYAVSTFISALTSINEIEQGISASIFPNPTDGRIYIELHNEVRNGRLTIFDAKGAVLYSEEQINNTNKLSLDLRKYTDGIYFISITEGDKAYTNKILLRKN